MYGKICNRKENSKMNGRMKSRRELEERYLSAGRVEEFDSIVRSWQKRRRICSISAIAAAVVIILCVGVIWRNENALPDISTIEVMQTIQAFTEYSMDELEYINIKPQECGLIVSAHFKDGTKRNYIMSRGSDGSTIELTAQN
ncbi:MAG: hypothetical protein PUI09_00350 [bacterium]|nr:hypothetical protein [bacterium]MDY2650002.1 hypothetical protein [Candidatus Egerieousia sp.]